jgi:hypothetical protein
MLALAGAAYAATVTPKYILHAKVSPTKSGTARHGVPIASQFGFNVTTAPPGQRPPVVQGYRFYFQGVRANLKYFHACSTSTLNSKGPSGCRAGSKIGTGSFTVALGPSASTTIAGTCVADLGIYNGGGNTLIFYVFKGTETNACPLPAPGEFTVVVRLSKAHKGRDMVQNFSVPTALRHPVTGVDAAVIKATTSVNKVTTVRTVRVGGRKVKRTIGLFESEYCPPNHQRNVQATFTPEGQATNGRLATAHVACK